jgi:hypothetical protein
MPRKFWAVATNSGAAWAATAVRSSRDSPPITNLIVLFIAYLHLLQSMIHVSSKVTNMTNLPGKSSAGIPL